MIENDDMYKPIIGAMLIDELSRAGVSGGSDQEPDGQRDQLLNTLHVDLNALQTRRAWDRLETEVFLGEEQYDEASSS